jgi:hypothetical protein
MSLGLESGFSVRPEESVVIASALARFLDHPPPTPGTPSRLDDVMRLALHGGMAAPR